jgi:hypothetical protein
MAKSSHEGMTQFFTRPLKAECRGIWRWRSQIITDPRNDVGTVGSCCKQTDQTNQTTLFLGSWCLLWRPEQSVAPLILQASDPWTSPQIFIGALACRVSLKLVSQKSSKQMGYKWKQAMFQSLCDASLHALCHACLIAAGFTSFT